MVVGGSCHHATKETNGSASTGATILRLSCCQTCQGGYDDVRVMSV